MYGMNYDQLVNNRVARQRVDDSPDVQAVLEGYVRPMQQYRPETAWKKYLDQSDAVRANYGTKKEALDTSLRAAGMTGSEYKAAYSALQQQEFGELTGLQNALGITFEDKNAPPDTVDAALNAYFDVDLNAYTDPTTKEVDWEGFYDDRETTLAGLSDTDRADVDWYLSRHESELHRDFQRAFDEIIKPSGYLQSREEVSKGLGIDLDTLQDAARQELLSRGARAGMADVWPVVDAVLNQGLETKLGKNAPTLSDLRNALRQASPQLDVELYRQGYVDKVQTLQAVQLANNLKAQYPDRAYFTPPVVKGAK
jgi:glutathione S-transferase